MSPKDAVQRGRFITLEGLEGVGKSTAAQWLDRYLEAQGVELVLTREPGGTALGERLRELVLSADGSLQAGTELLLMVAARLEHTRNVIEPALAGGRWVLSDRYVDASVAYQGGGRELGIDRVEHLHRLLELDLEPDLTLLFDLPIETGQARMRQRGEPDRIEQEDRAFFERARKAYRQRAEQFPERIHVIDAGVTLDEVQAAMCQVLTRTGWLSEPLVTVE